MRITYHGAAGEVTGSCTLVETHTARLLVDFGIFQGGESSALKNRDLAGLNLRQLDAVVLTHAHLDHCGRLPLLAAGGFHGPILATPASADFTRLVLEDSARLQVSDVERINRRRLRRGRPTIEPLYGPDEVQAIVGRFQAVPYGVTREVAKGVWLRFFDAGHILGSASVELSVEERGRRRVLVFSGDLGPRGVPILRDPVPPDPPAGADLVVLESTYGDRDHRSLEATVDEFRAILEQAVADGGKVLVPAFAIGRSQQLLYHIAAFVRDGVLPGFPVYLDSPMAIKAIELYRKHFDLFDEEAMGLVRKHRFEQDLPELRLTSSAEESRAINAQPGMAVIIAGSGMCEGGRIVHHLKHNLWRHGVHVVIVGFQSPGSLGRQLVQGARQVRIHGERVVVRAQVHTLGGFSAHAGQSELVDWAAHFLSGPTRPRLILTHGEDPARQALREVLTRKFGIAPETPMRGETHTLD